MTHNISYHTKRQRANLPAYTILKKCTIHLLLSFLCLGFGIWNLGFVTSTQAQPSNDNCANAIALSVNAGCLGGTTQNATIEGSEVKGACEDLTPTQSVWYSFTATDDSMESMENETDIDIIKKK